MLVLSLCGTITLHACIRKQIVRISAASMHEMVQQCPQCGQQGGRDDEMIQFDNCLCSIKLLTNRHSGLELLYS